MIRLLMGGLLALFGAWLAMWATSQQGYVAVNWSGWLIETSVSFIVLLLVLGALVSYGVLRVILGVWRLPLRWRRWRQAKRDQLPMKQLAAGMQALALQSDQDAMDQLVRGHDSSQWLRYLLAAQLAQAQNHAQQRDQLVAKALSLAPEQAFTIQLLHARWLMPEHPDQALMIIDALLTHYPKQRTLKALRVQALADLKQWQALADYLPTAKNALSRATYLSLQAQHIAAQLTNATDRQQLDAYWHDVSRSLQRHPLVAHAYVQRALGWGASQALWDIVVRALEQRWDTQLLPLLAKLIGHDLYRELKQVQQWQQRHGDEAALWWLSGLLAQRQGMTLLAEQDLKQSLRLAPSIPAALALSDLYAQQANPEAGRVLLSQQLQEQLAS